MPRAKPFFLNSFSSSLFTFDRKVITVFFLTKTVWPILPISSHEVISFLHPFDQQDEKNRR